MALAIDVSLLGLTSDFGHRRDLDLDDPGERSRRGEEALSRRVQAGPGRVVLVEARSADQVGRRCTFVSLAVGPQPNAVTLLVIL